MNATTIRHTKDGIVTLTWYEDRDVNKYKPVRQVYGVCFNEKGELLIIKEKGKWKIPGGTPEENEIPQQTLIRELDEEASVTVSKLMPIGVQHVLISGNTDTVKGNEYYQYRYICLIDKLLDQTPDPDTGVIYERKFVPAADITAWVEWGEVGDAMFEVAIKRYKDLV